jgi:hypothetical protein
MPVRPGKIWPPKTPTLRSRRRHSGPIVYAVPIIFQTRRCYCEEKMDVD